MSNNFEIEFKFFISDIEYDTNMDAAESRAINNLQNPYRGNFAGTGYGNILGSANLNGVNKFQNNVLNQISNHGNFPKAPAFANGVNANLNLQNQLTQQGAKMKNLKRQQSVLQIRQQNQQLQNLQILQKQKQQEEILRKEKLNQLKKNKFANSYTANNEQNALFNKLKSNKKNSMQSNTFRKSDLQSNKVSQIKDYGFYDYDTDYYDVG